jgi:hypothetical protein
MNKRTVRTRKAALPQTRREIDDPVVAIGQKIAAVIAALERNEKEPAPSTGIDWRSPITWPPSRRWLDRSRRQASRAACSRSRS